jgi:hypothetical protein
MSADARLVQAILDEDVVAVERWLRAGADANAGADRCSREAPDAESLFPLIVVAACVGNANIARLLLSHGAQVDAYWREAKPYGHQAGGFSWHPRGDALSAAAERGHVDVVEALLQANARWRDIALKKAAEARQRAVVRFMLAFGCAPHIDAFLAAVRNGDVPMIALFIEHGANLESREYWGNGDSPLALARPLPPRTGRDVAAAQGAAGDASDAQEGRRRDRCVAVEAAGAAGTEAQEAQAARGRAQAGGGVVVVSKASERIAGALHRSGHHFGGVVTRTE